jgi:hypothetical protein
MYIFSHLGIFPRLGDCLLWAVVLNIYRKFWNTFLHKTSYVLHVLATFGAIAYFSKSSGHLASDDQKSLTLFYIGKQKE